MIRYLHGTVADKFRNQIILNVHDVGYGVNVTTATLTNYNIGDALSLYISESIREDAHDLFGFANADERDMFELLRKVSGIGPKVALSLISFYSPTDLQDIIFAGDEAKLSLVPGIGKKVASKIIVELKDRAKPSGAIAASADNDTIDALLSLGYSHHEVSQILNKVPASLSSSSEKITWILQHLGE